MYAAVDKKKKKKKSREASNNSKKNYPTDAEIVATENQAKAQDRPSLEEMYAVGPQEAKEEWRAREDGSINSCTYCGVTVYSRSQDATIKKYMIYIYIHINLSMIVILFH